MRRTWVLPRGGPHVTASSWLFRAKPISAIVTSVIISPVMC